MTGFVKVSTATETREAAQRLARLVVEARLAAGAQIIGPVVSVVWHLGEIVEGEEWQLLLQTRAEQFEQLAAYLVEHHPWDTPEISAAPIVVGSPGYLDWLDRMTAPAPLG